MYIWRKYLYLGRKLKSGERAYIVYLMRADIWGSAHTWGEKKKLKLKSGERAYIW